MSQSCLDLFRSPDHAFPLNVLGQRNQYNSTARLVPLFPPNVFGHKSPGSPKYPVKDMPAHRQAYDYWQHLPVSPCTPISQASGLAIGKKSTSFLNADAHHKWTVSDECKVLFEATNTLSGIFDPIQYILLDRHINRAV
ncbi:hypothetical protein BXZ70DRAFT_907884 [Cristinia sonorae]|uniref:Uncharacterized protein n=1 Tax=Cristinia sonorae TaxID=1940300 RepID=A0A8K0ULT1_9AGAR|nr:hypothetical protein BXZ70DRAFT_907884 [Cristinia sonorae]